MRNSRKQVCAGNFLRGSCNTIKCRHIRMFRAFDFYVNSHVPSLLIYDLL